MDGMDSVLRYNPIYGIVGSVKFCRTNRSISALDFLREFDYRADQLAEVAAVAVVDNLAFRTVCSVDPVLIGPANFDVSSESAPQSRQPWYRYPRNSLKYPIAEHQSKPTSGAS
jgi:hypothetical protein